jgi:predicted enzyme related to lactoylglutathione lyase
MANQFVWVDIPVLKLDRAIRFYSADHRHAEVEKNEYPGMSIGTFPAQGQRGGRLPFPERQGEAVRRRAPRLSSMRTAG